LWLTPIILPTWEAESGKIVIQGQLGKKVQDASISTNKKLTIVVFTCYCHLAIVGSVNRGIAFQASQA
jgi:hypothetical protein